MLSQQESECARQLVLCTLHYALAWFCNLKAKGVGLSYTSAGSLVKNGERSLSATLLDIEAPGSWNWYDMYMYM